MKMNSSKCLLVCARMEGGSQGEECHEVPAMDTAEVTAFNKEGTSMLGSHFQLRTRKQRKSNKNCAEVDIKCD